MDEIVVMDNGVEKRTLNSFGLHAYPEHENPASADFVYLSETISDTTWLFGSNNKNKVISIPCFYFGSQSDFQRLIDSLNHFFFDEYLKPRVIKTFFDYDSDRYMNTRVNTPFELNRSSGNKELTINLIAFDGKKYSSDKASEILWGSEKINFKANYKLGDTGTGANALTITSNQSLDTFVDGKAVKPSIKIVGTGTNVKLTCAGRSITVGTFTSKTIIIDTEMFIAYFDGVETLIDMDDFYIVPNSKVSVTGTGMNFVLTIDYQNVYM